MCGYLLVRIPRAAVVAVVALLAVSVCGGLLQRMKGSNLAEPWWLIPLFFTSGLVIRQRTTASASANALDQSAMFRVGLAALVGVSLVAYFTRPGRLRLADIRLGIFAPLAIYSLWAALSTAWSVNPSWSLDRSLEFLLGVVLFAALSTYVAAHPKIPWYHQTRKVTAVVWSLMGILLASALISALLIPSRGIVSSPGIIGFSLEGVYPVVSRNGVGALSAMLILVLISRSASRGDGSSVPYFLGISICAITLFSFTDALCSPWSDHWDWCNSAMPTDICDSRGDPACYAVFALSPTSETTTAQYLRRGQNAQQLSSSHQSYRLLECCLGEGENAPTRGLRRLRWRTLPRSKRLRSHAFERSRNLARSGR